MARAALPVVCLAAWGLGACTTDEPPEPAPTEAVEPVTSAPIAFSMEVPPEPEPAPEPEDSGDEGSREVRIDGEPILVGAMGLAEFVEVLEANRPDLARCTRARLPEPKVVVKLTISKDGAVVGASMKTPSGSLSVDHCLVKRFREMKFPPHTSGLVVAAVPIDLGAERGALPAPAAPPPLVDTTQDPERTTAPDGSNAPLASPASEGTGGKGGPEGPITPGGSAPPG